MDSKSLAMGAAVGAATAYIITRKFNNDFSDPEQMSKRFLHRQALLPSKCAEFCRLPSLPSLSETTHRSLIYQTGHCLLSPSA